MIKNCDCLEKVPKNMEKKIIESIGADKIAEVKEKGFDNATLVMFGGPNRVFMTYNMTYVAKKANGEPENRNKKKSINVMGTFCPFCGNKYHTDEELSKLNQKKK
jgi:hypothetical protein